MEIKHETDFNLLRQKAMLLEDENQILGRKVATLMRENLQLKGLSPEQLQKALFQLDQQLQRGAQPEAERTPRSEKREPEQAKPERKPQRGHGPTPQPELPISPVRHTLDDADKICPRCGEALCEWEGHADESEEITVISRQFVINKHICEKWRCKCGHLEMAEKPARLIPGGRYSNDFAVEVTVDKFENHLPLERQLRAMLNQGLDVTSATLWDQTLALAMALSPAWRRLRDAAITSAVVGYDETRWELLTKGSASKKSWAMWELSTRNIVYFAIADNRGAEAGKSLLEGFAGIAVGDAATVHKSMAKTAKYRLAYCWAHGRRKFVACEKSEPTRVAEFLDMVRQLYAIEDRAPPGPDGDDLRRQLRHTESRPLVAKIEAWLLAQRALPESDFAGAMKYVANHWKGLTVFLDEPEVPLDNNRTERGFRGPAIGRHNHFGSHSKRGTEVAAICYSLVETAKLNGIAPRDYLKLALAAALDNTAIPLPHELT